MHGENDFFVEVSKNLTVGGSKNYFVRQSKFSSRTLKLIARMLKLFSVNKKVSVSR